MSAMENGLREITAQEITDTVARLCGEACIDLPEDVVAALERGQEREELVELRDVLPTFLDAAGLPRPASLDGSSLLDALRGRPWRTVLDLEHASCYDPKDGWVALMDERYKYIYYELTGEQRLFDLKNDPHELVDLAGDSSAQGLVGQWRRRMVEHLAVRGAAWVKDDELTVQSKPILFRANNPHVETF